MANPNSTEFTKRFVRLRKQAGFKSSLELSRAIGISHPILANAESGRKKGLTHGLTLDVLIRVCEATKQPITAFVPELAEYLPSEAYTRKQELLKELAELESQPNV